MYSENETVIQKLSDILPPTLFGVCKSFMEAYEGISEIRFRRNRAIGFTQGINNIESGFICDDRYFDNCLTMWTGTERYKLSDNLSKGVIILPNGFRIGITGAALLNNGKIDSIYSISSMNLRIPRLFENVSLPLYDFLSTLPFQRHSSLIISPPCGGKTTVLRDIARILSTPPVSERVCVVDTRSELFPYVDKRCLHLDVFSGYPVSLGIESATKYFNPRYVICDEIGDETELKALRSASHSGVPLIASVHSSSLSEAVLKPTIRMLLEECVFFNVIELKLRDGEMKYVFHDRAEVNKTLCMQNYSLLQ